MNYFEVWQNIRDMRPKDRKQVAYELRLKGCHVDSIYPYRYPEQKQAKFIEFYAPGEKKWVDNKYYDELKLLLENDSTIRLCFNRCRLLPSFLNDWREEKAVKSYILARFNNEYADAVYQILPEIDLAGERQRSLSITLKDGSKVMYKMAACKQKGNLLELEFSKM